MNDNDRQESAKREKKSLDPSALVPEPKRPQQGENGERDNRSPEKPSEATEKK